ncbi:hypothetical protein [Yersinia aleksiciae]|uniref:hypothetical protein n=1 Tax=Yersinia aleksiciae TaxID=263819 RepID=UPI001643F084|nr:hypothetical protein [Yersinia aleksiciae]
MSNITIDFNKLVLGSAKKLFAGRANGQQAYDYFKLNEFNTGSSDRISIFIPNDIVVW